MGKGKSIGRNLASELKPGQGSETPVIVPAVEYQRSRSEQIKTRAKLGEGIKGQAVLI